MAKVKLGLAATALLAGTGATLPPPSRNLPANELMIATTAQIAPILRKVAIQLEQNRPGVHVVIEPVGSDVAMSELFTHRADLAIIGRRAFDPELKAFQWIHQYPAAEWPVLEGSRSSAGHSPAVRVVVNAVNPIQQISAQQLDAIFRGDKPVYWRDLGVTGHLGRRAVHPIMPDSEQGSGRFIRQTLFGDATLFAWSRVKEIAEPIHRDGSDDLLNERLSAAVARDPQAIALGPGGSTGTKTVPLRCSVCDPAGTIERAVYAYTDPTLSPSANAFLQLLVSGTEDRLIDPTPYRQLPPAAAAQVLKKLQ